MRELTYINGSIIPNIPEWNKVTHPYACMWKYDFFGALNGRELYMHVFAVSTEPFTWTEDGLFASPTSTTMELWQASVYWWMDEWETVEDPSKALTSWEPVWCNANILNTDGSVHLESSPQPDTLLLVNMKDFRTGLAMGLAGSGLPASGLPSSPQPIAYLYNGVQLPELPEVEGTPPKTQQMRRGSLDG